MCVFKVYKREHSLSFPLLSIKFLSLDYCNCSLACSDFVLFQSIHHTTNLVISLPFGMELSILSELYKVRYSLSPRPPGGLWASGESHGLWSHPVWVWILILPLTYCENLNKFLVPSLPWFPYLYKGNSYHSYVMGWWKINKTSYEKFIEKCLEHSEHTIN